MHLSVPQTMKGQMSGMCGRFDGLRENKWRTSGGIETTNPFDFARSWAVDTSECKDVFDEGFFKECVSQAFNPLYSNGFFFLV